MNAEGYSEAVYKAILSGTKPADALVRLEAILARNGHTPLYGRILRLLQVRVGQDEVKNTAVIRVARETDAEKYMKGVGEFLSTQGLEETKVVIDESLIGGYVVEGKGARVDASYKTSLLSIYKNLVK